MSAKLAVATPKEVARVAERLGFEFRRQRGSHPVYVRASDRARLVIPMDAGEVKRGTLRAIIRGMKITVEEFRQAL